VENSNPEEGKKKRNKKQDPKEEVKPMDISALRNVMGTFANNEELQRSIDNWIANNKQKRQENIRDLSMLKSVVEEYLDGFILFGYTISGERIVVTSYPTPKDKDAVLEFLRFVFFHQMNQRQDDDSDESDEL